LIKLSLDGVFIRRRVVTVFRFLFGLGALLVWQVGFSANSPIEPYSGATLIQQRDSVGTAEYRLPLGGLRPNQGVLLPENSQKIVARRMVFTHEIDRSNLPSEVLEYFLGQFQTQGFQVLFQCESVACGDNSHWANTVFKQRKLNGLDRSQTLFTLSRDSGRDYLIFYLVQRGNKNIYSHIEWFYEIEQGAEKQAAITSGHLYLYDMLQKQNRVRLEGAVISADGSFSRQRNEATVTSVSDLFVAHPALNLVLVGHDESKREFEESLEFSTLIAQNAAQVLGEIASNSSIPAHGVGPLAPVRGRTKAQGSPSFWLELVLLP